MDRGGGREAAEERIRGGGSPAEDGIAVEGEEKEVPKCAL